MRASSFATADTCSLVCVPSRAAYRWIPLLPLVTGIGYDPNYVQVVRALGGPDVLVDGEVVSGYEAVGDHEVADWEIGEGTHVAESAASRYLGPQTSDLESRQDLAALEALAEQLRQRGIPAKAVLGHGDVGPELARLVNESGADLLVTGSHGHRMLGDLVHGATVSAVRHLVHCPVLTVRQQERGGPGGRG